MENKTYVVTWDERHSVTLKANNEQEAIEEVNKGEYDMANEGAEMNGSYEVEEIKLAD